MFKLNGSHLSAGHVGGKHLFVYKFNSLYFLLIIYCIVKQKNYNSLAKTKATGVFFDTLDGQAVVL